MTKHDVQVNLLNLPQLFFLHFSVQQNYLLSLFPVAGIRMMKITPQISDPDAITKPESMLSNL